MALQKLDYLKETPSQTAGPYVHIGLAPGAAGFNIYREELGHDICGPDAAGERIRISGRVIDGSGATVKDAMIEAWQANSEGVYLGSGDDQAAEDGFRGWGRIITDFDTGEWSLDTVKPGAVADREERLQAPHINLWVVARGINIGLNTRLYFSDEEEANANDPVINMIELQWRRATLIAERSESGEMPTYRFDIRLQGENETVFFDI